MITVTRTKVDGATVTSDIRGINSLMIVSGTLRPITANDTASAAVFTIATFDPNSNPIRQVWQVSETYAAVLSALTTDAAESGSAPLASPTFTGVPAAPTAAAGVITTQLATMEAVQNRLNYYAATTAGTDTYTCTLAPVPPAWVTGMEMNVKFGITNTGSATLNPNALGAKTLKKTDGTTNLAASDLVVGMLYRLFYDGTNLIVTNL